MGTAPDYLDPQEGYTTQSAEANWISYTPLVTYKHENAHRGQRADPRASRRPCRRSPADGKTYTLTLRKGLSSPTAQPVKASDFTYTVERMIKVNWGGKCFVTDYVAGATAFDEGKSQRHLGHQTDDATGKITIQLDQAVRRVHRTCSPSRELGLVPEWHADHTTSRNDPPPRASVRT